MSIQPIPPTAGPFVGDPFYAMGVADAYDEHQSGEDVHLLRRRADEMLDTPSHSRPADLYVVGYATTVIELMNGHGAEIDAQTEVAWRDRNQNRETSTTDAR